MARGAQRQRRRRWRREDGSIMPVFVGLTWVTVMMGVLFFQTGRATDLGAEAQTGADAAALAAAEDIRNQIIEYLLAGGPYTQGDFIHNELRSRGAAALYATRNHVRIERISFNRIDFTFDVYVNATTLRDLTPLGHVGEDPETGERQEFTVGDGQVGDQEATARVTPGVASFLAAGGAGGGGGGGAPTSVNGTCAIGGGDLDRLARQAGVSADFARSSALSRYASCDGGVAVAGLSDGMKVSLLRLEQAMGQPLNLNSAYRSPAYQAQLCQRVAGPCAPPGASLHNIGLAVDVSNWQAAAAAVSQDPAIGLCQPLPGNDAVHFSHVTGRECGGRTGASNGGVPGGNGSPANYGGYASLTAQVGLTVALIE